MFSGVAGLKSHQTKMDVIGNNIANVNTYGYKSQRAIFSDIYYQTLRGASAGTASRGGTNPSSVGYGSSLSAVQTQMTQSSMQNTGYGLDVAITGEGFLQVMDPDGNIFYTKAGLLDYDSNGYLVDINGNFVLGAGSADGTPSNQKIRLDNVNAVDPSVSGVTETINGIEDTITASNPTKYANTSISIGSSSALPAGLKATATIASTGSITVLLNENEQFNSMAELNAVINQAIREANNGMDTAAGTFTITASENKFGTEATAGAYTGSGQADDATITPSTNFYGGAFTISDFDPASGTPSQANIQLVSTQNLIEDPGGGAYTLTATINGVAYTGLMYTNQTNNANITMTGTDGGTITLKVLDNTKLTTQLATPTSNEFSVEGPQYFLGGIQIAGVSSTFPYTGNATFSIGTAANPAYDFATDGANIPITLTVNSKAYEGTATIGTNATTITLSTSDPADGEITLSIPDESTFLKNLSQTTSLTSMNNLTQAILENSITNMDKNYRVIAAKAAQTTPLTGAQITGTNFGTITGTITKTDGSPFAAFGDGMTFVRTSTDFTGSGVVDQSKFNAYYRKDASDNPFWEVKMSVDGKDYIGTIYKNTTSTTLLLKNAEDGDYVQVTNPGFEAMTDWFKTASGNATDPIPSADNNNLNTISAFKENTTLDVVPSEKSREMGLSSIAFALTGGTEGGAVTLDELTSISIGADGTITVTHPEKGTVVVGKISLATFANDAGLQLEGTNYYSETVNSGTAKLCDPGSDGSGSLKSSALEMSNVDLSSEFAEMITTQRGYQANARIITVSDTMLEELINLKR